MNSLSHWSVRIATCSLLALHAQGAAPEPRELVLQSLKYLQQSQKQTTEGQAFYSGEWPSQIYNDEPIYMLGEKGKTAYDSNAFTSASIHSSLATLLKHHPEYEMIRPMLQKSVENLDRYRNPETQAYGFWQFYPSKTDPSVLVRRPNHYELESKFINGAANVPEDADDTAVALIARKLNHELQIEPQAPESIGSIFARWRDQHRWSVHYYNLVYGFKVRTGAYLTWLNKEKVLNPLAPLPKENKTYVPYGANEVDCVVNANVLTALAHYNELDTPGAESACRFINRSIQRGNFARCGVYYPNRYHFHYAAMKAIEAGATCLDESRDKLLEDLVSNQEKDGGFTTEIPHDFFQKLGDGLNMTMIKMMDKKQLSEASLKNLDGVDPQDRVQSTLYAMAALLRLKKAGMEVSPAVLDQGIQFLQQNVIVEGDTAHWRGGVFFAGGTLIRNAMRWRSDAYSTAIGADVMQMYIDLSGGQAK